MRFKMDVGGVIRKGLLALVIAFAPVIAMAATILPQGKTQFLDNNGNPLTSGTVGFYIPSTTTPKNTWQDAAKNTLNTNPVILDAGGRATIYGEGSYRMIVKNAAGSTIYDAVTAGSGAESGSSSVYWGGTSGGSANAQTITAADFTGADGQVIAFIAGLTNTGALTIDPSNFAATAIRKDLPGGPVALIGGEVRAGNLIMAVYDSAAGYFHLVNQPDPFGGQAVAGVTAAAITDVLGSNGTVVSVTGGTTINSLGTRPNQFKIVYFTGVNTLTHNATTLILPGGTNITTAANDAMGVISDGSGNARVVWYQGPGVAVFNPAIDNNFTATQSITITGNGAVLNGVSTDAGSVSGPNVMLYRDSATPAASDFIGAIVADGEDSAANRTTYGTAGFQISNATDASEAATFYLSMMVAGAPVTTMTMTGATTTFSSVDGGAGGDPIVALSRASASPAAADNIGVIRFNGRDSGANAVTYGNLSAVIDDPTDGSEDAYLYAQTTIAGSLGTRLRVGGGLFHPSATGGDQGNNTINFGTLYQDGSPMRNATTSSFRATNGSTSQALSTTGALTTINFGTEGYDQGSDFASSTWTPPAGRVAMSVFISLSNDGSANAFIAITKNSTTVLGGVQIEADSVTNRYPVTLTVSDVANGTDTYNVRYYTSSAGFTAVAQENLSGSDYQATVFTGWMIGGT